jgi:hypothetical protein
VVAGFRNALVLLAVVGFFAALLGILRPTIGMLGIAILCTIDSVARAYLLTGGLWRWNTFNYLLLFVIFLGLPFLLRLHDPQTRLLQAFVLLLGVGLAFSVERPSGVQQILNIVTVFGLLRYLAVGTRGREIWHWMAMVSGAVAGAGGFVFYLQVGGLPEINPNAWSLFPLTALFLITLGVFAAAGRGRIPMVLPLLAALNATWVFLSGSRGSC